MAVECGLTLAQVLDHSPAQLKLLKSAANRVRSGTVLTNMNACYAAFAAVMVKGGKEVFEKMASELQKSANDE